MRKFTILPILLILWLVTASLHAESPIGAALETFVQSEKLPGAVSIAAAPDGTLTIDCVGWADVEKKVPMRPDTMFWIASMSKGMTCAALLTLVDEGKLSLDDPVEKFLPEFASVKVGVPNEDGTVTLRAPKTKMTIRNVLSHTAGFPFITPQMQQFGIDVFSMRHQASVAASQPLLSDPGTKFQYSNVGINIGAAVIEVVSGKPYAEFMQERIFDPLGMKDATFWPNEEQMSRMVTHYQVSDTDSPKKLEHRPFLQEPYSDRNKRFAEGGGGIFCTPQDTIKFYQMIANRGVWNGKRILSEASIEELGKKQTGENVQNSYSLGMNVHDDWIEHGGALQTDGCACPKLGWSCIYFVQLSGNLKPSATDAWRNAVIAFITDRTRQ